jgi:hypothetical protein
MTDGVASAHARNARSKMEPPPGPAPAAAPCRQIEASGGSDSMHSASSTTKQATFNLASNETPAAGVRLVPPLKPSVKGRVSVLPRLHRGKKTCPGSSTPTTAMFVQRYTGAIAGGSLRARVWFSTRRFCSTAQHCYRDPAGEPEPACHDRRGG